jgi:hypothetical protein
LVVGREIVDIEDQYRDDAFGGGWHLSCLRCNEEKANAREKRDEGFRKEMGESGDTDSWSDGRCSRSGRRFGDLGTEEFGNELTSGEKNGEME